MFSDLDVCNDRIDDASYGLSPSFRFSFATFDKEIDRGIAAIAAAVEQLKNA